MTKELYWSDDAARYVDLLCTQGTYVADTRMRTTPTNEKYVGRVRYACVRHCPKRHGGVDKCPWKVHLLKYRSCECWLILEEGIYININIDNNEIVPGTIMRERTPLGGEGP